MVLGDLLVNLLASAIFTLGERGMKLTVSVPPLEQAITKTDFALTHLEGVAGALHRWCSSPSFGIICAKIEGGKEAVADATLIQSFIEITDYYVGEETDPAVSEILDLFFNTLNTEILNTSGGLAFHDRRMTAHHDDQKSSLLEVQDGISRIEGKIADLTTAIYTTDADNRRCEYSSDQGDERVISDKFTQDTGIQNGGMASPFDLMLRNNFNELASLVSASTERELLNVRDAWRSGDPTPAVQWIQEVKATPKRWEVLDPTIQARILCLEASLKIDLDNDLNAAKELADQARQISQTSNEMRLRALIALQEFGPDEALRYVESLDDIESLHQRVAILMLKGQFSDGKAILYQIFKGDRDMQPTAETYRLVALAAFVEEDLPRARQEIGRALELQPEWHHLLYNAAQIYFYSIFAIPLVQNHVPAWPQPVDLSLVKRDKETIDHLHRAQEIFRRLLHSLPPSGEQRQRIDSWLLACLACDIERQEEAEAFCQDLVNKNAVQYQAILWAQTRDWEIDFKRCESALKQCYIDGQANSFQIIALVRCYLRHDNVSDGLSLLQATKPLFEKEGLSLLNIDWQTRALCIAGKVDEALDLLSKTSDALDPRANSRMLHLRAQQDGNWEPMLEHIEQLLASKDDPNILDWCRLLASRGEWALIAEHAEVLLEQLEIPELVDLTCYACVNEKKYSCCLDILTKHQHVFGEEELPDEIHRLQAECLLQVGRLVEAEAMAKSLSKSNPSTPNLLLEAFIYRSKPDITALILVARELVIRHDLPVNAALDLALLVHDKDSVLAQQLWRNAQAQGIPDIAVGVAVTTGMRLGLPQELGPLFLRAQAWDNPEPAGLWTGNVSELLGILKQRQTVVRELSEQYQQARCPLHAIIGQFNCTFADLYHGLLTVNARLLQPDAHPPLYIRYGSSPYKMPPFANQQRHRLFVDISAILLAHHFDLLPIIETRYAPLRIPASLVPALHAMRNQCRPVQPECIAASKQITEMVNQGSIRIVDLPPIDLVGGFSEHDTWVRALRPMTVYARENDGLVIDFLPKTNLDGTAINLPVEDIAVILNCRQLLETMMGQRLISPVEYEDVKKALGTEGCATPLGSQPAAGKVLIGTRTVLLLLAQSGLLELVGRSFPVVMNHADHEAIKSGMTANEESEQHGHWLEELMERIRRGQESGVYELMPAYEEREPTEKPVIETDEMRCLTAIAMRSAVLGDIAWFDDRFMSRYPCLDQHMPIVGVYDVLQDLARDGVLTQADYYRKYIELLSANVRYIPVLTNDLLFFLKQSRIEYGRVVPTHNLSIIRRYLVVCAQQQSCLDLPVADKEGAGELPYLFEIREAIEDAISAVWCSEIDDKMMSEAYADWLMETLEDIGMEHLWGIVTPLEGDTQDAVLGSQLAHFLARALTSSQRDGIVADHNEYLIWVKKVIRRNLQDGHTLLPIIRQALGGYMSHHIEQGNYSAINLTTLCDESLFGLEEAIS